MTHPTAEHDSTYATIAYVALALKGEADLRKAESQRVNDLLSAHSETFKVLVSGIKDSVRTEVDRIDALFSTAARDILAGQGRTETTAANLATSVKELADSTAKGVEDTRKANQATVDRSNEMFDERIKPLEAAMNTSGGRTPVIEKVLFAVLGSGLAILGAIVGRLAIGT